MPHGKEINLEVLQRGSGLFWILRAWESGHTAGHSSRDLSSLFRLRFVFLRRS